MIPNQPPANKSDLLVRRMQLADLPAALELQAQSYPEFLIESEEAFASRLNVAAPYCLVASLDGALVGYLLAHGWPRQAPPTVGELLSRTAPSEVLFIHDLSVGAAGRGLGIGSKLVQNAFERAAHDGLQIAELIAVEGAATYWASLGFIEVTADPTLANKVAKYGREARWMELQFAPTFRNV